jgi:hypothetical protein
MMVFAQMPQRVVVLASAVLFSCWLASMSFMLIVLVKCDSLKTCTRLYGFYKISKSFKRCFCRLCVSRIWTVTLRQNRWQHLLQYMQRFKETIFQMYNILYLFFIWPGRAQKTTIAKHIPDLRKLIRKGCRHIQVHGTTGCGKSRILPSIVAEEVQLQGKTLVLTTSTVDVTGMQKDAWLSSCYRMGDGRYGGDDESGSHC